MTDSKKMWAKPELIVLVRNNPLEAVLGACKDASGTWIGENVQALACLGDVTGNCATGCQQLSAS